MFNLTVRARDRGAPALTSETHLAVEVIDVNENVHAPRFDDFVTTASVAENAPAGASVGRVRAADADAAPGDDARVSYAIRSGTGLGLFSIDNDGESLRRCSVAFVSSARSLLYASDVRPMARDARFGSPKSAIVYAPIQWKTRNRVFPSYNLNGVDHFRFVALKWSLWPFVFSRGHSTTVSKVDFTIQNRVLFMLRSNGKQ